MLASLVLKTLKMAAVSSSKTSATPVKLQVATPRNIVRAVGIANLAAPKDWQTSTGVRAVRKLPLYWNNS
jgi:hypothetical protein